MLKLIFSYCFLLKKILVPSRYYKISLLKKNQTFIGILSPYDNKDKINAYSLNSRSAIENHLNNDIVSTEIVKMYG